MKLFVNLPFYLYEFILSSVCVRIHYFGLHLSYGIEQNQSLA